MFRTVIISSALLISSVASAQVQVVAVPVSCYDCGGERFHHAHCDAAQKGPGQKGAPSHAAMPQEDAGQYVAPPANGPVFGESNSVGIEGLSFHLPPLNLALPTLKLPSFFRVRNNARMITKPSEAPYQAAGPASSPVQLMMLPSSSPAASNVPDPPAATGPAQQDPGQKSPVQDSFKGVGYAPRVSGHHDVHELRQLQAQVQQLQQMLGRIAETKEAVRAQPQRLSSRLPATHVGAARQYAQPANHVEPARLSVPTGSLQRLPSAY